MSLTPKSSLEIKQLELVIHLGWPEKERSKRQLVLADLHIHFNESPKACVSDHLDDTVCYASLIKQLVAQTQDKTFHLIEHVAENLYTLLKAALPPQAFKCAFPKNRT